MGSIPSSLLGRRVTFRKPGDIIIKSNCFSCLLNSSHAASTFLKREIFDMTSVHVASGLSSFRSAMMEESLAELRPTM